MKKKKSMILAMLAFLLLAGISKADAPPYYFTINSSCADNICVTGENATWLVNIFNSGNHNLEFVEIELVNPLNHSTFAGLEIPFYPYKDNRGNLIPVGINRNVNVNFTGIIPEANSIEESLIYYPCFTIAIYDFYTIARDDRYEQRQCFNVNYTMPVFKCISNNNCIGDEFCRFRKCQKLNCTSCQYISDHSCADYQCCSNEQCSVSQNCLNHTCINLQCDYNQFAFNHSCSTLDCRQEEYISNRTCRKIECLSNEFAFNHTCASLQCAESEFIYNHTCRLLNCNEDEYIKEHICIPLDCAPEEFVSNHECKKLDCHFFQDIINHSCINNNEVIVKLALELLALAVIVAFLLVDFNKYEKLHSKRNIEGKNLKPEDAANESSKIKSYPKPSLPAKMKNILSLIIEKPKSLVMWLISRLKK